MFYPSYQMFYCTNNGASSLVFLTCGVPQGCILGPLVILFKYSSFRPSDKTVQLYVLLIFC